MARDHSAGRGKNYLDVNYSQLHNLNLFSSYITTILLSSLTAAVTVQSIDFLRAFMTTVSINNQ